MYVGKLNPLVLVECENGKEVHGKRTEAQLYKAGYKKACLTERTSEDDVESWEEYPTCIVQVWTPAETE